MDFEDLFEKYQNLLAENKTLKEENEALKAKLGINVKKGFDQDQGNANNFTLELVAQESPCKIQLSALKDFANTADKISLFMSLFKGRYDVYAKRWQSKDGRSGYAPVCLNEWKSGLCRKPKIKCFDCPHKSYDVLDEKVIEAHLRGDIVAGIYPMCQDDTCHFLAIDFDDDGWQKDISTLKEVCFTFDIPVAIERSRSGSGAHAWFFFENLISANLARKLGSALLTYSMGRRHEITFKSYDRFFPSQDTMPKGGFGNLIALPLQKKVRDSGNSIFIDEKFNPFEDQWMFLANIRKLSEDEITALIPKLCRGNEMGTLKAADEERIKPWEKDQLKWSKADFPKEVKIVKANMIYIEKSSISQKGLNVLKRLAAFKNPEFYKAQAMRMPTYNKSRIISCADETPDYLCLPRGCESDVISVLAEAGAEAIWTDNTNPGRHIKVDFIGTLREEQQLAAEEMLKYENGVLSATTAFGKTVIAAKLIAERKINTLILVHRQQLLSQWVAKLTEFLKIDEELPVLEKKRGRKKQQSLIGQIGAGKNNPSSIIDIAIMQSLSSGGEVKEWIKNYGMVIVDECHHVPAFSFEQILKNVYAKYVYGLTATPARQDGHHPIIFMHCGPIRYKVDAKKQAEKRPFEHYVIPRFTSFRMPFEAERKEISIQELYSEIVVDEFRNQLIVDDVINAFQNGRNSLVLTERTAHVAELAKKLGENIPGVIALTGGMGTKVTRDIWTRISETPADKQLTLIATGKYIGEGFDEARLDTLFLAMPISWKGTLQQYAGRLHRLFENKSDAQIYDYADIHVRVLEKMYNKRLAGYASIGYKTKTGLFTDESIDVIFDNNNFLPVYKNDLVNATREILIVSPFVTKRRALQMLELMSVALDQKVKVTIMTRPATDFKDKPALEDTLSVLKTAGVNLVCKSNIHQKYAVIDQRIVWYGSINLLSFGRAEESIMRLNSPNIANELMRNID
ncbi:MAG: DEAD/DEAH box helicase family protein [Smithella sp.]|jgi:superfamily II DNA or RNA helicase